MKRRTFIQSSAAVTVAASLYPGMAMASAGARPIRLGSQLYEPYDDPGAWITQLQKLGYRAAYCPVGTDADEKEIRAYEEAAKKHDVVISEVGAWSNTIDPDQEKAAGAIETCIAGLELAEQIGAKCCVNISGSRNQKYWAGPHEDNFSPEEFDQVSASTSW